MDPQRHIVFGDGPCESGYAPDGCGDIRYRRCRCPICSAPGAAAAVEVQVEGGVDVYILARPEKLLGAVRYARQQYRAAHPERR